MQETKIFVKKSKLASTVTGSGIIEKTKNFSFSKFLKNFSNAKNPEQQKSLLENHKDDLSRTNRVQRLLSLFPRDADVRTLVMNVLANNPQPSL